MKKLIVMTTLAVVLTSGIAIATNSTTVQGEYLEARSASVYVGACHFGAEYVEGGKEATLVWNINSGDWNGVSLDGITVVAVISAKDNLAIDIKSRKSVLYMDEKTTPEQRKALSDMLSTECNDVLGDVIATRVDGITYTKKGTKYDVTVGKVLTLSVNRYPCANCTQPHQIWYEPLTKVENAIVGKSEVFRYKDKFLPVKWQQGETLNNVFVGSFSL